MNSLLAATVILFVFHKVELSSSRMVDEYCKKIFAEVGDGDDNANLVLLIYLSTMSNS